MKKIISSSVIILALAASASAATVITSSFNPTGSSSSAFGFAGGPALFTDGFAYDPDAPTVALPDQTMNGGVSAHPDHFHGNEPNNTDVILNFTLDSTLTTSASAATFFVDIYARSSAESVTDRDNDFDVILLNGSTVVASVTGLAAPDTGIVHNRATFDSLALGTVIDGYRIVGHDTADAQNYFSLSEVRAGTIAVPEPSSTVLLGLGGLALIFRRSK